MAKGVAYEWTDWMHAFCMARPDLTRRELTEEFNAFFGTDRTQKSIESFCKRNGYLTGRTGCFVKGQVPVNKGRRGWSAPGTEKTRFKKGNRPQTQVPVWTMSQTSPRYHPDGSLKMAAMWRIKIAEPNTWEFLHRLHWMDAHGPIPKGRAIIFIDGDCNNVDVSNLAMVTRGELGLLNKYYKLPDASPEERETLINLARLHYRASMAMLTEEERDQVEARGLKVSTVLARIKNGWPKRAAMTAPLGTRRTHLKYHRTEA